MIGLPPEVAAAIRLGALPDVDDDLRVLVAGHVVGYLTRRSWTLVDQGWSYTSSYADRSVITTDQRAALSDLMGDLVTGLGGMYHDGAERVERAYPDGLVRGRRP